MSKKYLVVIGGAFILTCEYVLLSSGLSILSIIRFVEHKIFRVPLRHMDLSLLPGHPISHFLGVCGFLLILGVLAYSIRKNAPPGLRIGKISSWLDYHIICGTLGPIFIIFHAHFGSKGLVLVSYWSMIICVISGFIGNYLHQQTSAMRGYWNEILEDLDASLEDFAPKLTPPVSPSALQKCKEQAVILAGGEKQPFRGTPSHNLKLVCWSMLGDLRMKIVHSRSYDPPAAGALLSQLRSYGIIQRRSNFYDQYESSFEAWRKFHLPLVGFMYLMALVHIIIAILVRVHVHGKTWH